MCVCVCVCLSDRPSGQVKAKMVHGLLNRVLRVTIIKQQEALVVEGSYPFAEVQLAYSTAPVDRALYSI